MDDYKIGDLISCDGHYFGIVVRIKPNKNYYYLDVLNLQNNVRQVNIYKKGVIITRPTYKVIKNG